jgi:hypothetical protein
MYVPHVQYAEWSAQCTCTLHAGMLVLRVVFIFFIKGKLALQSEVSLYVSSLP